MQFEALVAKLNAAEGLSEQHKLVRQLCIKALAKANMANMEIEGLEERIEERDEMISALHRRLAAHLEYEKELLDERDEMRLQLSKYRLLGGAEDTMMVIYGESGAVLYRGKMDHTGYVLYSIHDCVKGRWSKNSLPGEDRLYMSLDAWLDLRKNHAIYGINE